MVSIEFSPVRIDKGASIYSAKVASEKDSEFEKFMFRFNNTDDRFINNDFHRILLAIEHFANFSAKERFFRNEGKMKDRVVAIPLDTIKRDKKKHGTLRLYCIRLSDKLLVLGGGGIKVTDSYDVDPRLKSQVKFLQKIDKKLFLLERDGADLENEIMNLTINI